MPAALAMPTRRPLRRARIAARNGWNVAAMPRLLVSYVARIDHDPRRLEALRLRPGLHLGAAARHQREAVARTVVARGQRLADAAGCARDEGDRRRAHRRRSAAGKV